MYNLLCSYTYLYSSPYLFPIILWNFKALGNQKVINRTDLYIFSYSYNIIVCKWKTWCSKDPSPIRTVGQHSFWKAVSFFSSTYYYSSDYRLDINYFKFTFVRNHEWFLILFYDIKCKPFGILGTHLKTLKNSSPIYNVRPNIICSISLPHISPNARIFSSNQQICSIVRVSFKFCDHWVEKQIRQLNT